MPVRLSRRALERHRRAGGRAPFAVPGGFNDAPFEGYFWRFAEPETGRVAIVLCGISRGSSSLLGLASHPGSEPRWALVEPARGESGRFGLRVGEWLRAGSGQLELDLPDGSGARFGLHGLRRYPRRALGAVGPGQLLPGLEHYWQPVLLGGTASGEVVLDGEALELSGARVYAERTWGRVFPERWWWGQADAFPEGDVCVTFAGGPLDLGGLRAHPSAAVVRLGERLIALAPPLAAARAAVAPGRWAVRLSSPRYRLELKGEEEGAGAALLPVPSADGSSVRLRSWHVLAGRLAVRLSERGRGLVFAGESSLAGLEQAVAP